jgi:nucleoside-diphosphate-sugar epimerase
MRFLVTGGAGFIGSSIVARLLARGDSVIVLDDFSSGREANLAGLAGALEVVRGDVRDAALVAKVVRGVDGVFHEAAMPSVARSIAEPAACDEINTHGTLGILEAARKAGVSRVVFAASAAAYGDDPELPKREDMAPRPLSPYAVSKVAGEHYMRVYADLHGMKTVSLRYFNVYGPRQDPKSDYAAAIPSFTARLVSGVAPVIFGDGEQTRDFCHIDDVVSANVLAMECADARGQVINVATGESVTINVLVATLARVIGTDVTPTHGEPRAGDIRHSRADISRAREVLGYAPRVSLDEGLVSTVAWFRPEGER